MGISISLASKTSEQEHLQPKTFSKKRLPTNSSSSNPRRTQKQVKMGKKVTSKEGMVAEVKKKITEMQFELDKMSDEVDNLNKKLEEERALRETAESEVLALHRKLAMTEVNLERTEEKLKE